MAFPALKPTSRSFDTGSYPVKTFKAQSGAEVRILYGDKKSGAKLSLGYENITDDQAAQFLVHFDETKGTYGTFDINADTRAGWQLSQAPFGFRIGTGAKWRYEGPPEITTVRPGVSTVRVELVSVL